MHYFHFQHKIFSCLKFCSSSNLYYTATDTIKNMHARMPTKARMAMVLLRPRPRQSTFAFLCNLDLQISVLTYILTLLKSHTLSSNFYSKCTCIVLANLLCSSCSEISLVFDIRTMTPSMRRKSTGLCESFSTVTTRIRLFTCMY